MATRCTANVYIKEEIKEEQLEDHGLVIDLKSIMNTRAGTNSHDSSPDEEEQDMALSSEMFLAANGDEGSEGSKEMMDVDELLLCTSVK